ncbi:ROK family protein [Zunongwangia pacifica]|uniref:ROK family protein n=1 Tax=Zunongwangia pacifica TaxID=2911062 RepID=A0A9X2CLH5_9FLAO|nr:ROK family protein [Zunongwangia pacifica]MCL6220036.1 ROK family protein [Zunongwangia pacifica]
MNIAIGADIGGTHITSAAIDLDSFSVIENSYYNQKIDNKSPKEVIFKQWASCLNNSIKAVDASYNTILGVGIAIPGPFDYARGIGKYERNDKYESLYNVSVLDGLATEIKNSGIELRFLNDASSFGVGSDLLENLNEERTIAITLGTGFGATFLENKVPLIWGSGVPENGCLWDKNFKEGIADDYFSTRWLINHYGDLTGNDITGLGVKELLDSDPENMKQVFTDFGNNLCEFLYPHLKAFDTDVLFIGGNIAKASAYFLDILEACIAEGKLKTKIRIVTEAEKVGVIGAAYLFNPDFWERIRTALPSI